MGSLVNGLRQAGLWTRMALWISLGFLVLFLAFALLSERALNDSTGRILEERLVIARLAANQIDNVLLEALEELKQAHRYRAVAPWDPGSAVDASPMRSEPGGLAAARRKGEDKTGRTILLRPPALYLPGMDLSRWPAVSEALAEGIPAVSAPFLDPVQNHPVVAVTLPVQENGRLVAAVLGLVDLGGFAILDPLHKAASLGSTGHASLVDRNGRSIASTYDIPFLSPGEHADFYRRALAGGAAVVENVPFEFEWEDEEKGELHVMAIAPLVEAPWGVAVGGDHSETFASLNQLRLGLVLLGALALVGVWTLTLFGTRRLLRPVRVMTLAAQEFASGELNRPLSLSGSGEIGSLASALEKMRAQLLANIAELSSWNTKLETRVQEQTESLRRQQAITRLLLRRVLTAQEEERARISRELHDEIGQMLTAIELNLDRLAGANSGLARDEIARIESLRTLTDQALINLRRVISAMRPGVLDELGLIPALGWIIDHTLRPLGIQATLEVVGIEDRLAGDIETILFRIAQEAISNTVRHSRAGSFTVRLEKSAGEIAMTLSDDGLGFDQSRSREWNGRTLRLGLAGMHERASLVGGKVLIESERGRGTTVTVRIPLDHRAGSDVAVDTRYDQPVLGLPSMTLKEPASIGELDP